MTTVLLLEDDETLSLMYRRLFEVYFDCDVTEATDGERGLELVNEQRPDLVVLDVHLPKKSGLEVLQAMRDDPSTACTPCIAITAENHREVIERLVAGRVMDILLKPVVPARDVERIRKVIAKIHAVR